MLLRNIPYEVIGGISFYKRKEIQDILAFARLLIAPQDMIAFERIINLPKRGLGPSTISSLIDYARSKQLSIIDGCYQCLQNKHIRLTKNQQQGIASFLQMYMTWQHQLSTLPLYDLLLSIIHTSNYFDVLREDPDTFDDRKANLDALLSKTYEWKQSHPTGSLANFLEELTLQTSHDELSSHPADRVHLMTLHNGKGLEFPIVFLVGLEEQLFPHANAYGQQESLEEERRLCYVGITRAQDLLYITAAQSRFLWGSIRAMKLSRFLKEIPPQYITPLRT